MQDSIQKAQILVEAFPYIRQWYGSTVVVKYGGSTRSGAEELKTTLQDIVLMKFVGMRPVVVHGGGKDITRLTEKMGIHSKFVDGLRVTDLPTMEIVEMVLGGKINKELVSVIHQLGGSAVGLSGKDGAMLEASRIKSKSGKDIGFVGKVAKVNTVKYYLKEARLQNSVLTNRNGIRGITTRVSKHIIAKPEEHQKSNYVDVAGIGGRKKALTGGYLGI